MPAVTRGRASTVTDLGDGTVLRSGGRPDNVLMSPAGPVVIDWTNAHGGDPDADMAMTWVILETSAGPPGRLLARLFRSRVGRDALRRGLHAARAFRLADPNVTDAERSRVRRADP